MGEEEGFEVRTAAIWLLLVTSLLGQQSDKTAGAFNGRYWAARTLEVKLGIVVGFVMAIQSTYGIPMETRERYAVEGNVGDLVRGLDTFYRNEDVQIPIWLAIRLVKLHQAGASDVEIAEEWARVARPVNPPK